MFTNYITVAFRNIMKSKVYSALNIGGLAVGMAVSIMISLFVIDELSFDNFHQDKERIFKLETTYKDKDGTVKFAVSPGRIGYDLQREFADEIEAVANIWRTGYQFKTDLIKRSTGLALVNADFHKIFDLKMMQGSLQELHNDTTSIVMSDEMALAFFGRHDVIGETIEVDNGRYSLKVVGVLMPQPENSTMAFSLIGNFETFREHQEYYLMNIWLSSNFHNYIKVKEASGAVRIEQRFPDYIDLSLIHI